MNAGNAISGVLGLVSSAASYVADQAAQIALNAWLATAETAPAAHIAAGIALETASQMTAPLVAAGGGILPVRNVQDAISKWVSSNPKTAEIMNTITRATLFPNIEGIVIFAEKEQCTRKSDVSEHIMVVQAQAAGSNYATDNAVPHPREWTISGYLTTILPSDHFLILKPSISMQRAFLNMCMTARRPVWYKTFDNIFAKVLITNFDYAYDPKSMNTLQVNLQLREYTPYVVRRATVPQSLLNKLSTVVIK